MENREMIISPYSGTVETVSVDEGARVYEWEPLFTVRTSAGDFEEIRVGLCGMIDSLEVERGDEVVPGMVLAYLNEDLIASGSD
ncbi:MAG TPA: hypothetical protein VFK33_04950 [Bacillales bacterium]|nr:hypothetical protein [Bacillales bacterium]